MIKYFVLKEYEMSSLILKDDNNILFELYYDDVGQLTWFQVERSKRGYRSYELVEVTYDWLISNRQDRGYFSKYHKSQAKRLFYEELLNEN